MSGIKFYYPDFFSFYFPPRNVVYVQYFTQYKRISDIRDLKIEPEKTSLHFGIASADSTLLIIQE